MFDKPELFWLGIILGLGGIAFLLSQFAPQPRTRTDARSLSDLEGEIAQLQAQCRRLRDELQQQSSQWRDDLKEETFAQLQSLLTSFPTARQMARVKPSLPAQNLVALFAPLENMLQSWGYESIGEAWEQVPYNPQLHQPDAEALVPGELVYIRFVGYREGDRVLCPAKVSRTLPNSH
jgi:molecular chaperone GrpE (heat shock protein)